ncbi:MAG: hypothetical protein K8R36_24915, partial [Planctomycetales bacterium]|nr:hypothetical protein [Planctomycetales bacterium]
NLWADVGSFLVSLVAMFLLIPLQGTLGAALATLVTMTADAAMRWFILLQTMRSISAGRSA